MPISGPEPAEGPGGFPTWLFRFDTDWSSPPGLEGADAIAMLERDPSQTHVPGGTPGDAEDPTAPTGSRPAQNARQVASTSEVDTEWRGADEAADFLGLDQELRGVDAAPIPAMPHASDAQHFAPLAGVASAEVESAPTQTPAESLGSLFSTLEDAPVDAGDDPLAPDLATPDPFAFEESAFAETPRQRGVRWYALRAVAALVLVSLGLYTYTTYFQPAQEVQPPTTVKSPVRPTAPVGTSSGQDTSTVRATDDGALASSSAEDLDSISEQSTRPEDTDLASASVGDSDDALGRIARGEALESALMPSPEFEQWMRDNNRAVWHGRDALAEFQAQGGSGLFDPLSQWESIPAMRDAIAAADRLSTGQASSDAFADASRDSSTETSVVRLSERAGEDAPRPAPKSRLRRATAGDLAGIWEGGTIPVESMDASTRMLTPAVGRVRTILRGGEVFEGRLYAVGQGKVWLDTELGRLALVADQVLKLEQLASPDGTPVLGQAGSEVLAGLPRVRARTPGGMFYGKVTSNDGKTVTLITDEGARITLDAPLIEPVPASRTVIVGSAPKP